MKTTRRVTVDIDIRREEHAGYALHFYLARLAESLPEVWRTVRVYRTRHGFHFDILLPVARGLSEVDGIRRYLGDDERRLCMDYDTRRKPEQVLFETRRGFEKVDITEEVMQDLASR